MQDFGAKADNSPPPGGQLSAAEFNNLAIENENAVLHSGQALSGASDTQLAQSLFLHGVKAGSFQDSGAANAYVATPVSGTSGVLLPGAYTNLPGAVITFKAANANSGASTLNIGQTTGTLLGTKPIRTQTDTALLAGSIVAGQYISAVYNPTFNGGVGAWELLPWSATFGRLLNIQVFKVAGSFTYTKTAGTTANYAECGGGGASGAGTPVTGSGQCAVGGPGGSGAFASAWFPSGIPSGTTITIGSGGAPVNGGGTNGGVSSIGALVSCPGGRFGSTAGPAAPPLLTGGGAGATGMATVTSGTSVVVTGGSAGGLSFAQSLGSNSIGSAPGADGHWGGGGASTSGNTPGNSALGPGSGGSGTATNAGQASIAGGAGADGIVIIYEYGSL